MYRKKLFLYFFIVFSLFTAAITLVYYNREIDLKKDNLNVILDNYADLIYNFILQNDLHHGEQFESLDSLHITIGRNNLRITIVDHQGNILFDSSRKDYAEMENHLWRPEIQTALADAFGTDIRLSDSTGEPYYYYAKNYPGLFVRTALDYDLDIQSFLRAGRMVFVIILILFILITLLLGYISDKFGKTLARLKDFSLKAARNEPFDPDVEFPDDELGVISRQIVLIYDKLSKAKDVISLEREKIIRHLYISKEGVAIFSAGKEKIMSTSMFIQNINYISEKPALKPEHVFNIPEFNEAAAFIDEKLTESEEVLQSGLPSKFILIKKRGRYFAVNVIIFSDKTFEISINDITIQEEEKAIKQQLTSNIAHELKTPVSSITAYLETILETEDLDIDKQKYFTSKAYSQAKRLSELISDISLLNKVEEAAVAIDSKSIIIGEVVRDIADTLKSPLHEKGISITIDVGEQVNVRGNASLIYSIFQNLIENTINHAGENVAIHVNNYFEDEDYYYFSYSDTGVGIPEKHINRIFERFYRVDKGRSRKSGGTGLGLAIVKNAVLFHQGDITVKNRQQGGLEFFFNLKKVPE